MLSLRTTLSFGAAALVVAAAACGGDDAANGNGVNDVKKACEIRVGWKNLDSSRCLECIGAAPAPPCECEAIKEFAGRCESQGAARAREPACTLKIEQCVNDCKKDCACIDVCYQESAACRAVSAARDGCVAEQCAAACN
ncbi:MAG: hypothetical protein JST00_16465 [Deltaproteobacteria bacterium]|nr:hypothetical protein [Deltaproteobacteria bacterium]